MRRVHRDESVPTSLNASISNSNLNFIMSTSNTDLSSIPNSTNGANSITDASINDSSNKWMVTSMINTPNSNESSPNATTFKAPLLQSILSKTRLNSILNKYDVGQSLAAAAASVTATSINSTVIISEAEQASDKNSALKIIEHESPLSQVRIELNDEDAKMSNISKSSVCSSTSSSAAASPQITITTTTNQESPSNTSTQPTSTTSATLVA